jgi:DNA-binding MarR family transcriptional regulator
VLRSLEECGAPAQLTREGKALLKHADAAVRMADQRILARLNADEQLRLKRLLYAGGTDSAH